VLVVVTAVHIIAVADGVGGIKAGAIGVIGAIGAGVGVGGVHVRVRTGVGVGDVQGGRGQGGVGGRVGRVGRRSRCNKTLELLGGLVGTADSTTLSTFLEGEGNVIGDLSGDLFDLGLVDAKSSRENIRGETEESLSDLVYAWERIAEEGDEGDRLTTVVIFVMDGTHREEGCLVGKDLIVDELSTILRDHAGDEGSVGDKIELWGPWMGMRSVHTTRTKETGSD